MFRYGSSYYIYNNGWWYKSHHWSGPYVAINDDYVPMAFQDFICIFGCMDGYRSF